jgi:recombination protein RecT
MTEQHPTTAITLKDYMRSEDVMVRFQEILGKTSAAAFVTSVLIAVSNNQYLQKCTRASIYTSAIRAASMRLSCDPATGHAHLVPYGETATLVVGYKGIQHMALRTGKYRYINPFVVYEGEILVEDRLTGVVRLEGGRKSDKVVGYGHYFEMLNGYIHCLYMTLEEIVQHAKTFSKSYNRPDSAWKTNFEAMAKKTVVRLNLTKHGYLDPTDQMLLEVADENANDTGNIIDGEAAPVVEDVPFDAPKKTEEQLLKEVGF